MLSAKNKLTAATLALTLIFGAPATRAQTVNDAANLANLATAATTPAPLNINTAPAKKIFGHEVTPSLQPPHAIGTYALGCMAGAQELPITGPNWQIMRISRHRNWALPQTISFIEQFAADAKANAGWNGLLVGDIAQPRGGPMLTGHESHQIGLDADIWFTPMPDRVMSAKERETFVPLEMVKDHYALNPDNWTEARAKLLKIAATNSAVARIFVHPPIKAALCDWAKNDKDKSWLAKIRPMQNHTFHFHVRLNCPDGMKSCKNQWKPNPPDGTGCGSELAYWMGGKAWQKPKPNPNAPPYVPPPPLTLSGLPAECRAVVAAP